MAKTGTATCRRGAINLATRDDCTCVTFHKRGGKPVHVWRCPDRKLRGHNKKQCRRGGSIKGARTVHKRGRKFVLSPKMLRNQFTKC